MIKKILLLTLFATLVFGANESFSKSKKMLKQIYKGHQFTIYCECKYNYKNKNNMIERDSCGYIPRNEYTKKGKRNERARRIEWEHLIPAENFGRQFACWREGNAECVGKNSKGYKGRKCCEKVNQQYRIMQADMHNLFPAVGELNGDRKNFRFDFEEASGGQYGACKFDVLFKEKRAKVREELRGVIARDYLYFNKRYGMKLSKQELKKFTAWNKLYPPNEWEKERNEKIEKMQGNGNPFILKLLH
ncbi:endonuclease [Sulfurimonas microaerophilic]|uniref:endonuclease n=1 Tax=Sulfurimonas microaerophilic TaxID=3058392 RepID=UPI0027155A3E|nr:endonuclease [Sulfurimonas sp. hsl 1-7]